MSEEATLDEFVEDDSGVDGEFAETAAGQLPVEWDTKNVEELCTLRNGKATNHTEIGEQQFLVYGSNGPIGSYSESNFDGGLIFGRVGAVGEVERVRDPVWVSDNAIQASVTDRCNTDFLYYYLSNKELGSLATKTAQPLLNQSTIGNVTVPSPPLPEQRKIATVLHNVDQAIQKTQEIIDQTRRVKQGVMDDVFEEGYDEHSGYDEVRIGPFTYNKPNNWDICSIEESKGGENGLRRGPFGGMLKKEIFVDSGYKVYQQQNVIYDDFDYGDYYITEEKFRDMERFSVRAGDILISCSGTLGKVAVVPDEYEEGVINQALLKFTVDEEMFQTQYMKYFLESKIGQRQLVLSSRGSAMKNMAPMEFVRSAQIFKPPTDEQEKISHALRSLDEKINVEEEKKKYLKKLKTGLMQDLLSGTVRTTNTNIEVPDEIAQYG